MKNYLAIAKRAYHNILKIPELLQKIDGMQASICKTDERINEIFGEIAYIQKSAEIMFWQEFRKDNENHADARKRFFASLPKATGGLRLLQKGNALLLKKLAEICDENGFPYWLSFGTLLGAVRHKGCIPWDDDVDIGMFRSDIEKLREILRNDAHYQVTLVYDYCDKNRQIRFRVRDLSIPCFVDIFIYDFCSDSSDDYLEKQKKRREKLIQAIETDSSEEVAFWRKHPLLDEKSEYAHYLEAMFKKFTDCDENAYESADNEKKAPAVCWGLDNFYAGWKHLFDWDFLFPCVSLEYEGEYYAVPKEFSAYLDIQYGDIWELPHDLISHTHVSHEEIENSRIKISAYLENTR